MLRLVTLLVLTVIVGAISYPAAMADDPAVKTPPQSAYRVTLDAQYRGGSAGGYGKSRAVAVTSTPASTSSALMSTDGVNLLHFANLGTGTVLCSLNGTQVSTANCQIYLPPGLTFTSITKSKVSTISYYCPTGTATLVIAE